jgi:hypothetical protein
LVVGELLAGSQRAIFTGLEADLKLSPGSFNAEGHGTSFRRTVRLYSVVSMAVKGEGEGVDFGVEEERAREARGGESGDF